MSVRGFLREHQSVLAALAIAAAVIAWMMSGAERQGPAPEAVTGNGAVGTYAERTFSVRVRNLTAEPVSKEVVVSGRTEPLRAVTVRAEIDGRVTTIAAERGAAVQAGDVIVRLDARDRAAQLQETEAAIQQRSLEYKAAKNLREKDYQTETQVAQALANLEAARARRERILVELAHLEIRAPFAGVIEERPVERGDFVKEGDTVARILDLDTILVVGNVSQGEIYDLHPGQHGSARLVTGQSVNGRLRFVSMQSDAATRTFEIELEVLNPDRQLLTGVTAEITIPVETLSAHRLSSSLLSLDENDRLGVKAVDDENRVVFHPVSVVKSSADALWVTGLPERVRVITVGQGYVNSGDRVMAVDEETIVADMP